MTDPTAAQVDQWMKELDGWLCGDWFQVKRANVRALLAHLADRLPPQPEEKMTLAHLPGSPMCPRHPLHRNPCPMCASPELPAQPDEQARRQALVDQMNLEAQEAGERMRKAERITADDLNVTVLPVADRLPQAPPQDDRLAAIKARLSSRGGDEGPAYSGGIEREAIAYLLTLVEGAAPLPLADATQTAQEQELRQWLWTNHGCPLSALYGDDGEMQCNGRGHAFDFRREPLADILSRLLAELTAAQKQIRIIGLSVSLEEELAGRIDEMLKYLAMQDGFTLNGIARLLVECQRRMAADWIEVGNLRRQLKAAEARVETLTQERNKDLLRLHTIRNLPRYSVDIRRGEAVLGDPTEGREVVMRRSDVLRILDKPPAAPPQAQEPRRCEVTYRCALPEGHDGPHAIEARSPQESK